MGKRVPTPSTRACSSWHNPAASHIPTQWVRPRSLTAQCRSSVGGPSSRGGSKIQAFPFVAQHPSPPPPPPAAGVPSAGGWRKGSEKAHLQKASRPGSNMHLLLPLTSPSHMARAQCVGTGGCCPGRVVQGQAVLPSNNDTVEGACTSRWLALFWGLTACLDA